MTASALAASGLGPGSLLLRATAKLPESLRLETRPFAPGWNLLVGESVSTLDRRLRDGGWNLFWVAGVVEGGGLALTRERALQRAFEEVLAQLDQRLNCVEVTDIRVRTLFWLHHASLAAQGRHLQKGFVLFRERPALLRPVTLAGREGGAPAVAQPQPASA